MEKNINFKNTIWTRQVNDLQFWLRAFVFAIDNFIIRYVILPITFLILQFLLQKLDIPFFNYKPTDNFNAIFENHFLISSTLYLLTFVLYSATLESSKLKATFGKWFVGFTVTDKKNNRISFLKGLARNIIKILSIVTLIGVMIIDINKKRQSLHDLIVGTVVLKRRKYN